MGLEIVTSFKKLTSSAYRYDTTLELILIYIQSNLINSNKPLHTSVKR